MLRLAAGMLLAVGLLAGWAWMPPAGRETAPRAVATRLEREPWDDPPPVARVSEAQRAALECVADRLAPALMQVGQPGGDAGTGFVISARHRLVATNAHVAAIFDETGGLQVVAAGGTHRYRVARVWYHPAYRRARAEGVVLRGGPVAVYSRSVGPDVAVLELAPGGPELVAECRLAAPGGDDPPDGAVVGKLGLAGPLTGRGPGRRPRFEAGAVSRVSAIAARWDVSRRWRLVDASTPMRHGDSGGPLFLSDGRVVAINAWGRRPSRPGAEGPTATTALRIDALTELLDAHGLGDRLTPAGAMAQPRMSTLRAR